MNTDQLLGQARARFDHVAARRLLKEKYQSKLLFAHSGGMWRASPELLSLLSVCDTDPNVVLLDIYETPVRVVPTELFELTKQHWQEQMNAYLVEYEELSKNR